MTSLTELFRVEGLPAFQNRMFPDARSARACTRGDLVLVQDAATGLVFNAAFDPTRLSYDADYQNEQGHSAAFQTHLDAVAAVIARHLHGRTLIEVGCGKGLFLERLQRDGFAVTGLDPAYEGDNPAVRREYFTAQTGLRADGLLLRHVLEHVQDPVAFLGRLRDANGGGGLLYIEVPCLDWIAEHRAWFDLFYEHVNYFRLDDFRRMFGRVVEAGRLFGGQYLFAMVDLATLRTPQPGAAIAWPADFTASLSVCADRLAAARTRGDRSAIWGGASKGVIFALHMERTGVPVDLVIDINPGKQGRYLAATGLRVHAPDEGLALLRDGAEVIVMNSNYLAEIRAMSGNRFTYLTVDR
jgi:hypothetical protein